MGKNIFKIQPKIMKNWRKKFQKTNKHGQKLAKIKQKRNYKKSRKLSKNIVN